MTPVLDLTVDSALELSFQEAVAPELLWQSLSSNGRCNWPETAHRISLVGVEPSHTFLILNRDVSPGDPRRFCQVTGGMNGLGLLIEIGDGDDVGIVAGAYAGWGRRIQITERDPWVVSSADELVLQPRENALSIAYNWVMLGVLNSEYCMRPVENYRIPSVVIC